MTNSLWRQRAAAAPTATLKHPKTKTVSHFYFSVFAQTLLLRSVNDLKAQVLKFTKSRIVLFSTVKKKYGAGLMFSNLMNIGKKKTSSLDSPEKCVDTSGE